MILVDFNNVAFSTVLQHLNRPGQKVEPDLIKHMILNSLRLINVKFRNQYKEMIIAVDSLVYWRKKIFPHYKANRKKQRDKANIDWTSLFQAIDQLKADLREAFPYKYIEVEGAEADDVIGVITKKTFGEQILIVSSDKDYMQLQNKPNVTQYDPVNKRFLKTADPVGLLLEHIIRGDAGDGIPNIASPGNCFVLGQRQNRVTKKLVEQYKGKGPWPQEFHDNFTRNEMLISLNKIPGEIAEAIEAEFWKQHDTPKDRSKLLSYFAKNKMKVMSEHISDF